MTSCRSQLQEDTYFRVLRLLQDNPDLTQREIANKLGLSTSGLNYCLMALIDKGWVKVHSSHAVDNLRQFAPLTAEVRDQPRGLQRESHRIFPVVSIYSPEKLNLSPLRGYSDVVFVKNPEELALALMSDSPRISSPTNIAKFFSVDIALPQWRQLLLNEEYIHETPKTNY